MVRAELKVARVSASSDGEGDEVRSPAPSRSTRRGDGCPERREDPRLDVCEGLGLSPRPGQDPAGAGVCGGREARAPAINQ